VGRPGHQIREDWVWRERTFLTNTAIGDDLTRPRVIVLDALGGLARELARVAREQIEFVAVEDVQQATSALDDCPAHAALVNAPRHHLWPLVDALRATSRGLPVFGCSIRPRPSRASQVGAHGYLVKPVTRRRLQQTVESLDIDVRRVLIVDDDPDVLQVFTRMLQALDPTLEISIASDGAQALSMARHTAPDLALIDLVLPGEDGWAVWDRLRSLANDHDMRAVFVSAQDPDRQPTGSRHLILTIDEGLAIAQILDCLLGISVGLLHPAANR
jgi:CheY-like chemotaxis protein